MLIKGIIDCDLINYKKPCMTIEMPFCDFKCNRECQEWVCQNSRLNDADNINIPQDVLISRYLNNEMVCAICFQGLEPFDSWNDLSYFIHNFRKQNSSDIVIYTGYTEEELSDKVAKLKKYPNIIIKFGRYIPYQKPHYDEILGVKLASDNQYAKQIS